MFFLFPQCSKSKVDRPLVGHFAEDRTRPEGVLLQCDQTAREEGTEKRSRRGGGTMGVDQSYGGGGIPALPPRETRKNR